MGSTNLFIIQNTSMAQGKTSLKNKLIKPFLALFRNNKKNNKSIENPERKASEEENATNETNERHVETPYENLLKKLEKLDIDKKTRLEATKTDNDDNDTICDSDIENDKELHEKFDKRQRNNTTSVYKNENDESDKESNKFVTKAGNDVSFNNQDEYSVIDNDEAELLEKFNELEIEKEVTQIEEDEEELKKFSSIIVSDDAKAVRNDSQSSEDSGFADKCSLIESDDENLDKDVDRIEEKDGEEEKKEGTRHKKLQKAYVRRGPIKSKRSQVATSAPYPHEINLNPEILSGGQVIINSNQIGQPPQSTPSTFSEASTSPSSVHSNFMYSLHTRNVESRLRSIDTSPSSDALSWNEHLERFRDINAQSTPSRFIEASTRTFIETSIESSESNNEIQLNRFLSQDEINKCLGFVFQDLAQPEFNPDCTNSPPALIPEFELCPPPYDDVNEDVLTDLDPYILTPPSSNSHSIDTSPSSDALSWSEDLERFGDINAPVCPSPIHAEIKESTPSELPRLYTKLKDYKDRQKELATQFSKMECCKMILRPCKEVFNEHLQKLQAGDRRQLCYSVANLEAKYAFRVLMHILEDLSRSDRAEDLKMALFCLVCEKVLSNQKTLFLEQFGLNILRFAVLRCFERPLITRYLVQCVRVVTRSADYTCPNKIVYTEVDANGDNLLIACVREGDKCANVLRELVRVDDNDVPLFDVHHVNTDGYTALHVCCSERSASTPRAHTLHVLLKHARAERERQDRKGGETPLHLAVNSANCSLDMILIYFHHIERSQWHSLANMRNSSGKKPIDYAKRGVNTRPNYPREILDFLGRCRKSNK